VSSGFGFELAENFGADIQREKCPETIRYFYDDAALRKTMSEFVGELGEKLLGRLREPAHRACVQVLPSMHMRRLVIIGVRIWDRHAVAGVLEQDWSGMEHTCPWTVDRRFHGFSSWQKAQPHLEGHRVCQAGAN
jgi:hypothetical protein